MTVVTLLHPGAMGAAVGRQAVSAGATVLWVGAGRSDATCRRALDAGLVERPDLDSALAESDVVLSICPPAFAEDVAREVAGFTGVYVEANAIAPERSRRIAGLLPSARVVDGGIIGGPPSQPGTTRLYLSGDATGVPELFAGTALDVVVLPGDVGVASALKIAYASYQKTTWALAAVSHALAAAHGVGDQLLAEAERLHARPLLQVDAYPNMAARGWRWAPEILEAAATLRAAGLPDGLARGSAETMRRWDAAKDRADLPIEDVLGLLG
ncbi:NAD(P)-dependent oxidoreductase [Kutzneria kofuensis]|uniref:3-hydroxyisobutyrate dehydrogenase-like beta-hydroxyacid dehydrogenase n=1 Tax=Kutzneria kofuensis TaxID=103725 RepID=A0A7W9NKA6_9PSEU|nr:NAD(P)-dependent oxidoreductase [Kutzneria kofuensis]MBB5895509.1 3-hydroxyisobutyrate dehydrogenase-like beta-hydroxyacid dehydrogenase [Kutzneria kofuensis]